ncbi:hypothetical protein ACJX0J_032344, partial [Zea mays]
SIQYENEAIHLQNSWGASSYVLFCDICKEHVGFLKKGAECPFLDVFELLAIFCVFFAWHTIFLFSLKTMKHLIIGIVIDSCVVSFVIINVNTYVFYNNHGSLNMFCYVIYGTINITMIFKIHMIKYHTHTDFSLKNRKLIVESEGIDIYFYLIYIIIILNNTLHVREDGNNLQITIALAYFTNLDFMYRFFTNNANATSTILQNFEWQPVIWIFA